MTEARFKKQIEGTKFQEDLGNVLRVNEGQMSRAVWNLILSKRDCNLYAKGIKPHRMWKISDVKWYFGIAGGAQKCAEQLEQYLEIVTPKKANNEQ